MVRAGQRNAALAQMNIIHCSGSHYPKKGVGESTSVISERSALSSHIFINTMAHLGMVSPFSAKFFCNELVNSTKYTRNPGYIIFLQLSLCTVGDRFCSEIDLLSTIVHLNINIFYTKCT